MPLTNLGNTFTGAATAYVSQGRPATGHFRFSARPNANDTQQLVIANGTSITYEADGAGGNVNWVRGANLAADMTAFKAALVANSTDCTFSDPIDLGGAAEYLITVRISSAARVAAGDGITTIAVPVNVGGGGTVQDNADEIAARAVQTWTYRRVVSAEDAAADYMVFDTPFTAINSYTVDVLTGAADLTRINTTNTYATSGGQLRVTFAGATKPVATNILQVTVQGA